MVDKNIVSQNVEGVQILMSKLICVKQGNVVNINCDFYQDQDGEIYMTGEQIGRCLGYKNPVQSISNIFKKFENRLAKNSTLIKLVSVDGKKRMNRLYNEQGIYFIAMRSDTEKALDFQEAVASIIKDLRKRYAKREALRISRRGLTDVIRDEIPDSPHKKFKYKHFTDLVYKAAISCSAKKFRQIHELDKDANIREYLSTEQIKAVDKYESLVKDLIRMGWEYEQVKNFLQCQLALTA